MTRYAHITGWGMAVPDTILTNADLEGMVDTTDEWITSRTGIRERRIASKTESTATLAARAGRKALESTTLSARDLDLVIVASASPEHLFPATACLVQDALGAVRAGRFRPLGGLQRIHLCRPSCFAGHPHRCDRQRAGHRRRDAVPACGLGRP